MDTVRRAIALMLTVVLPLTLIYWFLVHALVGVWRRFGPRLSYGLILTCVAVAGTIIYRQREAFLAVDFGTNYLLCALAVVCLVMAGRLRRAMSPSLTQRVIAGLPELAPQKHPVALITTGLHGRMRHPRYVQFALAMLGYALIANYLAPYVMLLLWMAGIQLIVLLEERELRARFGAEHEAYCRRVPRFIPRRSAVP
jgi:protein-S-isoprenylcysteine O-methyltransferase Ste14